ncbi:hypothetical protein [Acanthopleuribacter pedis]|uniref:TIGR02270 family protein n=1 Tax=Acanthopleuribacter pedis TaxID=442870 RepID=A0A8J7QEV0_9BACT|nr:hypothetical protein [Acanthopleuribacter pedis]MBO1317080.1 hypothetical protein [Acanthopleuribacter pedis]
MRRFYEALFEEHLEEASFFFEQRMYLIHDIELSWRDHEEYEVRFQRHYEGLLYGGEPALKACLEKGIDGDFGEFHTALRVFLQRDRYDLLCQVLDERPYLDEPEHRHAVWTAIVLTRNLDHAARFIGDVAERWPDLVPAAIQTIGWLRLEDQQPFLEDLQYGDVDYTEQLLEAWVRLAMPASLSTLEDIAFRGDQDGLRHWAALGLARLGSRRLLQFCLQDVSIGGWSLLPVSVCGNQTLSARLLEQYGLEGVKHGDALLALGLLGEAGAVPFLIQCLKDEIYGREAAEALNLITGADLFEETFVQEQVDEDELFEEEIEAWRNGEPARKADGSLAGEYVVTLTQTAATWETWWRDNVGRFHTDVWFRRGEPGHPRNCVAALMMETHANRLRWWLGQELFVRFNIDMRLELEMPINIQIGAAQHIARWIEEHGDQFLPGRWYFKGTVLGG